MERITLDNTEFEGRNNVYLLRGSEVALVDTGVATASTRDQLRAGLGERDLAFADVDRVLLTHWHADHVGLAGEIQAAGGATVHVHAADAPLVAGDPEARDAMEDRQRELFEQWGMPDEPREQLLAFFEASEGQQGDGPDVAPFEGGDVLAAGDRTVEVLHAPGHTAGLSCFVFDGDSEADDPEADDPEADGPDSGGTATDDSDTGGQEAFTGDAVLPHYTPNVGGADVRVDRPLEKYLETLRTVVERDFARAYPGHRDPIDDPTARARAILDHHRERAGNVVDTLSESGPADAWTVSADLFGSLEGIHILHGPGEAYAHLEHLADRDVVERVGDGAYDAPADADERLAAIGEEFEAE